LRQSRAVGAFVSEIKQYRADARFLFYKDRLGSCKLKKFWNADQIFAKFNQKSRNFVKFKVHIDTDPTLLRMLQ
jgi:hypothetical protein